MPLILAPPTWCKPYKSARRDAIIQEREQEFVFEQVMYPELRRKSKCGATPDLLGNHINHYITKYTAGRTLKARDYVLLLPLKEMQGNTNVTQHKEWQ